MTQPWVALMLVAAAPLAPDRSTPAPVTAVTVYRDRARVTRTATVVVILRTRHTSASSAPADIPRKRERRFLSTSPGRLIQNRRPTLPNRSGARESLKLPHGVVVFPVR